MNAVTDFRGWIGNVLRMQTFVDRFPSLPAVIAAKRTSSRDRHKHSFLIFWIDENGVEAHGREQQRFQERPRYGGEQ